LEPSKYKGGLFLHHLIGRLKKFLWIGELRHDTQSSLVHIALATEGVR
jgi:hypothetical protein